MLLYFITAVLRTPSVSKTYSSRKQNHHNHLVINSISLRHSFGATHSTTAISMLKNYIRIAWRNLLKNRTSSIINIAGLATGMAIALIIGLWIADELSFDHYHTNHSRLAKGMIIQHITEGVDVEEVVAVVNEIYPVMDGRGEGEDMFIEIEQGRLACQRAPQISARCGARFSGKN